jgi:hypothetical protein
MVSLLIKLEDKYQIYYTEIVEILFQKQRASNVTWNTPETKLEIRKWKFKVTKWFPSKN